jgi:hypothetical protein
VSEQLQSELSPNALKLMNELYQKGYSAGIADATSQQDKDKFVEGQFHAYDLILTSFSHAHSNMEMQVILQFVANLKKETKNAIPKEMDIL